MAYALPRLEARGVLGAHDLPLMQTLVDVVLYSRSVDFPLDVFLGS